MAALDFPSAPTLNQIFAAPSGYVYKWDNTAWISVIAPVTSEVKNFLVNGDLSTNQKNGTTAVLCTAGASTWFADMWRATVAGASVTALSVPGNYFGGLSNFVTQFAGAAGNTRIMPFQRLAGEDAYPLASKNCVLSFFLYVSTGTKSVTWRINAANAANNFTAKTLVASGSITLTTTQTRFSLPFVATALVANGLEVEIDMTSGLAAGQSMTLGAIQLELGDYVTSFETEEPAAKFDRCQRYYQQSLAVDGNAKLSGFMNIGGVYLGHADFNTKMRATPTVACVNTSNRGISGAVTPYAVGQNGFTAQGVCDSNQIDGFALFSWTATAEL